MVIVTWNPNDKSSRITLENSNLVALTTSIGQQSIVRATEGKKDGKWYFEVNWISGDRIDYCGVGISSNTTPLDLGTSHSTLLNTREAFYRGAGGTSSINNSSYGSSFTVGNTIGVAIDVGNKTLEFYKDGVSQGITNSFIQSVNVWYPTVLIYNVAKVVTNFGETSFKYPVPAGYEPYSQPNKTLILQDNGECKKWVYQRKYANFPFDEVSGNVIDTMNPSIIGTVTGATRVTGWNGEGKALSFNGTSDYVTFNSTVVPTGKKSIRFKFKSSYIPTGAYSHFISGTGSTGGLAGIVVTINTSGALVINWFNGSANAYSVTSVADVCNNQWRDILFTWDGTTNINGVKLYIDNMSTPNTVGTATSLETASAQMLTLGRSHGTRYFNGQLDNLEIYNEVYNPLTDETWQTVSTSSPPNKIDFESHGYNDFTSIPKSAWNSLYQQSPNIKLLTYVPKDNTLETITPIALAKGLSINALPIPQFIKQIRPNDIYGTINNFLANEVYSGYENGVIRYLISSDKVAWKTWNGSSFTSVNVSNMANIIKDGMTKETINSLSIDDWDTWTEEVMYLAIYLEEDVRDKTKAQINSITYKDSVPLESTLMSDARLYILNTVSTIDVTFQNNTLTGVIDDEDEGKVKYRVILNGAPYYPVGGGFTPLMPSPKNINITLNSQDFNVGMNNTLTIEFTDYWGTIDYRHFNFIGTYTGLLFTDVAGDYYSTDIGTILKNLDFGVIIAGQTTIEHEVRLKNTYGYPINNIRLYVREGSFPAGMRPMFGTNMASFEGLEEITINSTLESGSEIPFYIKLTTELGVTPPTIGDFNIIATADRVE